MKTKFILLCLLLVSSISLKAQSQQIKDANSNTWDYFETVSGVIWDDIWLDSYGTPWIPKTSGLYMAYGKMYIYYRQIGNKTLLRMIPTFENKIYNVQPNPYYGRNDNFGSGQFEYYVIVSKGTYIFFNLQTSSLTVSVLNLNMDAVNSIGLSTLRQGYYKIVGIEGEGNDTMLVCYYNLFSSDEFLEEEDEKVRVKQKPLFNKHSSCAGPIDVGDIIHVKSTELVEDIYNGRTYQAYKIKWEFV